MADYSNMNSKELIEEYTFVSTAAKKEIEAFMDKKMSDWEALVKQKRAAQAKQWLKLFMEQCRQWLIQLGQINLAMDEARTKAETAKKTLEYAQRSSRFVVASGEIAKAESRIKDLDDTITSCSQDIMSADRARKMAEDTLKKIEELEKAEQEKANAYRYGYGRDDER